jgi:hypothetical protein
MLAERETAYEQANVPLSRNDMNNRITELKRQDQ